MNNDKQKIFIKEVNHGDYAKEVTYFYIPEKYKDNPAELFKEITEAFKDDGDMLSIKVEVTVGIKNKQ